MGNNAFNVLFQLWNMAYNKTPKKIRFDRIVPMDDAVASVNYGFGIRQREITLYLKDSVYGFTHNFGFPFDCTSAEIVFFKNVITHRIVNEETLNILDCALYII